MAHSNPVKKTLVRNIEVPMRAQYSNSNIVPDVRPGDSRSKLGNQQRYTHAAQTTTHKIHEQMERIRKAPVSRSRNITDLTPNAINFVQTVASQRLNFPNSATIYKGLPPINVNDSVMDVQCDPNNYQRRLKSFVRSHDKDPEPILTDYLRPIEVMPRDKLDDFGCEQFRLVQGPDSDVFFEACELLDRLDCEI